MGIRPRSRAAFFLFLLLAVTTFSQADNKVRTTPQKSKAAGPLLLEVMDQELQRAMTELAKAEPAPYFISYSAIEHDTVMISATQGALFDTFIRKGRNVDVQVRVGSPELDNTRDSSGLGAIASSALPMDDDRDAIANVLWSTTDRQYKQAARSFLEARTQAAVKVTQEDDAPDFSLEKPSVSVTTPNPLLKIDRKLWEERVRKYSGVFRKYPEIHQSTVVMIADSANQYFVSSEGSKLLTKRPMARMMIYAQTRAEDGMDLFRAETFDATTVDGFPSDAEITAKVEELARDVVALRKAPVVDPYVGPAMLSGRAAAVFFHEVLGHRLEGQRQRGDEEGQTFTKMVNQRILPDFLSVVDDPTMRKLDGVELNGYYEFDQEGVAGQRVELVRDGVLREFLMSRRPIKDFNSSNGHGRAQEGLAPVGRQGNLIITSRNKIADEKMRAMLIEEVKKQGKPYGLYFEDIAGGFTLTTRFLPQAFQIIPIMVWKVYADGRPDELVRGVDIVGTPLVALNRLTVTGTKTEVFNGHCGAESGSVPVAAAAPAILFSEMEVQKKAVVRQRPPILPPPAFEHGMPPLAPAQTGGQQ